MYHIYIYIYIYKIGNETTEMISKYKKFSSKLVPCINLRRLFNTT